jgi:hypothetical protein
MLRHHLRILILTRQTYVYTVMPRYAVPSLTNDPQWDISVYAKAVMQSKYSFRQTSAVQR